MFDADRVRGFMENIFPDVPGPTGAARAHPGSRYVEAHASGRVPRSRWAIGVRGSVAVLFAIAAMGIGIAGSRLLLPARSSGLPPAPAVAAPARSVPAAPVAEPARRISLSTPPSLPALLEPAPPPVRLPERVAAVAAPVRRVVATPPIVGDGRGPTPHLTGVALQRALAQDVIDTRLLNEAVMRNQAATAARVASRGGD